MKIVHFENVTYLKLGNLHYLTVTEPEPEYGFPETMGDNCSDDDVPGMEGVSEQRTGNMVQVVMLTYKILLVNNIVHTH